MSPTLQTAATLALLVLTIAWFIRRAIIRRRNPGCGSDCGCPTADIKAKLTHRH